MTVYQVLEGDTPQPTPAPTAPTPEAYTGLGCAADDQNARVRHSDREPQPENREGRRQPPALSVKLVPPELSHGTCSHLYGTNF